MAIGSVTGALASARREKPRLRFIFGAAGGFGLAVGLASLMPNYYLFAASLMFVGFASLTMMTSANAYVQTTTAANYRGARDGDLCGRRHGRNPDRCALGRLGRRCLRSAHGLGRRRRLGDHRLHRRAGVDDHGEGPARPPRPEIADPAARELSRPSRARQIRARPV